jgi:transcriptional regulator with XRE-family HTH domain
MSQMELADRLGVSFQQVQKYEKGMNRVGAGRLHQIAGVFKVPVGAFYEAHAGTSRANGKAHAAPAKLIPDRSTLKLLASYQSITDPTIRRGLVQLVSGIAKAARKTNRRKSRH